MKQIYHFESFDIDNVKSSAKKIQKKINFGEILNSPQNQTVNFKINFLKERYGEKLNKLIEMIDKSDNVNDVLEDEKIIRDVIGEDYKIAQSFLKYVLAFYNK
jgi:hypothetical protein